ncbi:hypothetical protein [Paenibacillus jilunlii]|uniref:Lipoprotein n=1 Tax=Paenibacillus jilunlii TaxID=682956 RepID=A0ABR5SV88_9BACL|nr:hypothetical protein [Paenibacillus jilunlii]KWX75111.1 hypothetical protein AML91_13685 [Paenibacillus jilunlii]
MNHGLLILLLIISIGCSGCTSTNESHDLTITIGDESINFVSSDYSKDNNSENDKTIFEFAFKQDNLTDIKYIKLNTKITLDFGNNPPDSVAVKDILLDSNGKFLYSDKLSSDISLTNEGHKFFFLLNKNPASLLSSKFDNKKVDIRGFEITATWGLNEERYAFVIKADAY